MSFRKLLPFLWAAWIFISSCTVVTRGQWLGAVHSTAPGLATPKQLDSFWERYWWVFVKGYHFIEFFTLLALLVFAFPKVARHWLWLATVLYAISDEIHQLWVPARGANVTDVLIDTVGATTALLMISGYERSRQKRAR